MKGMLVNHCFAMNSVADKDSAAVLQQHSRCWYFTKDEIDNHSPSRKDGIDCKRESSLRKSYCSFLKDLGMRLQVSPVTAATATMFCHRFYMRQSHARNDWQTIATACMFLAGKAEDNLRPLRDIAMVSYEIIYKWDPCASQRIRRREVYYNQKELILDAEHLLLVTIAFDISIQHPFRPLVDALKRLKISNNDVAKVAWNLLNEWLRTIICLQYKPQYVAAASLSVAAKLLNFKLPMCKGNAWWLQFDVSPKLLEEVTQQMLGYFKHDVKQKMPQVPVNVIKPSVKVNNATSENTNSCVVSGLTIGSDPKDIEVGSAAARVQKPSSCETGLGKITKGNMMAKEASGYQSSDCCSGISSVVDSESAHTCPKIVHTDDSFRRIDIDRLKGAYERTRRLKVGKRKSITVEENEMDDDLFIETELEKGIELAEPTVAKKQKVCQHY